MNFSILSKMKTFLMKISLKRTSTLNRLLRLKTICSCASPMMTDGVRKLKTQSINGWLILRNLTHPNL